MLLLRDVPKIEIVGTACNGQDLLQQLDSKQQTTVSPDVILMDIDMDIMDGHEATKQVKCRYPEVKVIMLTRWDQKPDINKAVEQGANGFLSKKNGRDRIVDAIFRVFNHGEFVVYTELENENSPPTSVKASSSPIQLTERERKIISMLCQEWRIEQISTALRISTVTANTYLRNIRSKFRVRSNKALMQKAMINGLCQEDNS